MSSSMPGEAISSSTSHANEYADREDPTASGNLDKIREILFGAQARDHERRFAQLEQELRQEASDLRADLKRRFDILEGYIKQEVDNLSTKLTQEQELRGGAVRNLSQDLLQLTTALDHKTRHLEGQTVQAQRDLHQQFTARAAELATDIRTCQQDVSAALHQAVQELRAEKTGRRALAAILMEASKRLSEDSDHAHGQ